jgi:metal-sulfur cluster biosynthetic enzyme
MNVQEQVSERRQSQEQPTVAEKSQVPTTTAPPRMPSEEQVMELLRNVYDPEIMMSIVDLGLVYGVEVADGKLLVKMTLTTMACPLGPMIEQDVIQWCKRLVGIHEVKVQIVFDPPWNPSRMSQEAKLMLGMDI